MMVTALLLGIAGSLHCAGMCVPLVMTVSSMHRDAFIRRMIYNVGRILMYGTLGSIVGSIGYMLPIQHYQTIMSFSLGVALLLVALAGIGHMQLPWLTKKVNHFTQLVKKAFQSVLMKKGHISTFMLGTLNGLLPCGLTLLALTSCLTLPSAQEGFIFMIVFGAGTLPVMLGLTSLLGIALQRYQVSVRKLTTGLLIVSGSLLIARSVWDHQHHTHTIMPPDDIVICR